MPLLPKLKKVKCPDGRKVYVLRNPADAFRLYLTDEKRKFDSGIDVVQQVSARLGASHETTAGRLLVRIGESNGSLQAEFNAIYNVYVTDPCHDPNYLRDRVDEIRRERQFLDVMFGRIELIKILLATNAPSDQLVAALEEAIRATISPLVQQTITMVQEAPIEIARWRQS
jgi:hypothetical protein